MILTDFEVKVLTLLKEKGVIQDIEEPEMNVCPKVRRSKQFICTISGDRGEEATYAGFPISSVATPDTGKGIGDVVSLLWFKNNILHGLHNLLKQ